MAVDLIVLPFADQGDKQSVPLTDPSGFVNLTEGYTKYYEISLESGDPQAKAVERNIQNYLFNQLTGAAQMWQQMGFSAWFAGMPGGYAKNAMVMRQDTGTWVPYRSLVAANSTDPIGNPASWERIRTWAEISSKIPMMSGGATGNGPITGPTSLDTLETGTYWFNSDATAQACGVPVSPTDTAGRAGMIESSQWGTAANDKIQRFTNRFGIEFARGSSNGTWSPWIPQVDMPTQGDLASYAVDTGAANAINISTTLSPALVARKDGMVLKIKVKAANTGAVTINDGLGTVPLVGIISPLQVGELAANGEAWVQWNTSIGAAPGSYLLMESSGGAVQVGAARASNHATSAYQVQAGVLNYFDDIGTQNNYVIAPNPLTATALTPGQMFNFRATTNNSGPSTLQVNGMTAAKQIWGMGANPLQGGEIKVNGICTVIYESATDRFILLSSTNNTALQIASGLQSLQAVRRDQFTSPVITYGSEKANNTTVNTTVTLTAPGPGHLISIASRNNALQAASTNACQLWMNNGTGNINVADDNTQTSMTLFATRFTNGGGCSANFVCAAAVPFSSNIILVWLPQGLAI
jgi:hypothetical protein